MKKLLLLIIILLVTSINSFSQGANLDREYFNVSYVKLPSKPILDANKRTYSSNSNISLTGFTRVKSNGSINVDYTFNGTEVGEVDIKPTKHEKKDKEGNITSTSYTYKVHVTYTSTGSVSIANEINPANNFNNTYEEKDNYKSSDFKTRAKAKQYYSDNRYKIRNDHKSKHKKAIKGKISTSLNSTYGYVIKNTKDILWILGKKKHSEYEQHIANYEKAKEIFAKMEYNKPVEELRIEFKPIIAYFEDVVIRYPGSKKKQKKMRYASFYNISKIYYYLDQPEKAIEYAQKLIDNDYDKGDGKRMISLSDNVLKLFESNKLTTRHIEVVTKSLANSIEEPEEEVDEELEVSKGYLILRNNDTLTVDIKISDVPKIGNSVKTLKYDSNGGVEKINTIEAIACKELLLLDGTHYKNISFKSYSDKGGSSGMMTIGASQKLCKVVHESDKLSLYSFNDDKEPVLFVAGEKKGKSTQSPTFAFGFKKQLLKYAEGCESLKPKVENNEFENNTESLTTFCKELTSCE